MLLRKLIRRQPSVEYTVEPDSMSKGGARNYPGIFSIFNLNLHVNPWEEEAKGRHFNHRNRVLVLKHFLIKGLDDISCRLAINICMYISFRIKFILLKSYKFSMRY